MARILVLGATGYIGGRLVPRLVQRGHEVVCVARNPRKMQGIAGPAVRVVKGDVFDAVSLGEAFHDVDVLFYLVHSMSAGEREFEERDRTAAQNVSAVAREHGIRRIIYLGGLGRKDIPQSPHLRSRHEVADILRSSGVPTTEFRAAVIVGSGSASFEMMHHLVNRLPVMICPQWVTTRTQPIAIGDVLQYLLEAVDKPETAGVTIDIGGPDIMTYRDMMLAVAKVMGLKRLLLIVPVLTPRLSSYWVNLVTPIPAYLARSLIESLRSETICENHLAAELFSIRPKSFQEGVERALIRVNSELVETTWTAADGRATMEAIDPSHMLTDVRELDVDASPEQVFSVVASIGGRNGWYYADWLWDVRGFIDQQLGGVGLRRGRRHPTEIRTGEALDFWRVEEFEPAKRMVLRAEMKVWGHAWLEFKVEQGKPGQTRLSQIARYYPKGLFGHVYWYSVYPVHMVVFRGMIRAIARRAREASVRMT